VRDFYCIYVDNPPIVEDNQFINKTAAIMNKQDRFQGCLLGLACGDAVGTTNEFQKRGNCAILTDMVGGGVFGLKPGEWTDDTSMALCIAVSLTQKRTFHADDIMNRFSKWKGEGYLSSNGRCFDIGSTVRKALSDYSQTGNPYSGNISPKSAGNGCLMRLAPIPMFYHGDLDDALYYAELSSKTTHGAKECIDASRLFAGMVWRALNGATKSDILVGDDWNESASPRLISIAKREYRDKRSDSIRGNGYVVDSLEAALWCFDNTSNFRDCVLLAANLGDDADTTAAICGQLAGAFYGESGIPEAWRNRVVMGEYISQMGARLMRAGDAL
jgi:ADP-ribosyl-[dinitrogen reductase] hydrolase